MKPQVAVVAPDFNRNLVQQLFTELEHSGFQPTVCPEAERRAALRWVMELSAEQIRLCIFCDNDGRSTAALSTALDPAIVRICWCPEAGAPEQLPKLAYDLPLFVSFAKTPAILCQSLPAVQRAAELAPGGATSPSPKQAAIHSIPAKPAPVAAQEFDMADKAVYEQLESLMAAPIKKVIKQEPVQIQRPGLDFSNPLRKLMSQGRHVAQKSSSTEVLGAHYLAALEEPYSTHLANAGLSDQLVEQYLSGIASGDDIATEPIIGDEAFDAVARAKARARERDRNCIHIADYLEALLGQSEGSVADIIADGGLSREALNDAVSALDEIEEPAASPFFAPSSYDQDSFYEFDPAQVRTIEERLRTLPGFQKAAARVAEARTAHGAAAGSSNPAASPPTTVTVAADPPDKPEIVKVSAVFPSIEDIEHIADRLLEGQLVGFPADTMYALAADAANPVAIERLREAAGLPAEKPLSILINSTAQLKHLVRADLDALEPLFDELWPGPLTLVFTAAGSIARHVSSGGTIAVRQPGDNTSLAILSMLGRPLAVTSWDDTEPHEPVDVSKLTERLSGKAAIIVNHGEPVPQTQTTIVNLAASPWEIIREGAIAGESVLQYDKSR